MKINISTAPPQQTSPRSNLRETKSYNDSLGAATLDSKASGTGNTPATNGTHTRGVEVAPKKSFEEYDEYDDGAERMEMTFDSSFKDLPTPAHFAAKSPLPAQAETATSPREPSPDKPPPWSPETQPTWEDSTRVERPTLKSAKTEPTNGVNASPGYNAWADEFDDDFGTEKEIKMSFM